MQLGNHLFVYEAMAIQLPITDHHRAVQWRMVDCLHVDTGSSTHPRSVEYLMNLAEAYFTIIHHGPRRKVSPLLFSRFNYPDQTRFRNKKILFFAGPAVVVVFIIIVLAASGVFSPSSGFRVAPGFKCNSDECKEQSNRITSYARFDANPCEDFNEFTCGKYTAPSDAIHSTIQTDEKRILKDKVNLALDEALKKDIEGDFESIQYIKKAYRECIKEKTEYNYLRSIRNEIVITDSLEDKVATISSLGESVIIGVDAKPDPSDPSKTVLWLSPPEFGIQAEVLSGADDKATQMREQYARLMNSSMRSLFEDEKNYFDQITEAIKFESRLAKSALIDPTKKLKDTLTSITIKALQEVMGEEFKVWNFLNSLRLKTGTKFLFALDTPIYVKNIDYFKALGPQLAKARTSSLLTPYLSMRLIKSFQYLVDTKSVGSEGTLRQNKGEDVVATGPLSLCIDVLRKNAPMVLASVYVRHTSPPVISKDQIEEVLALVRHINLSFKEFIGNSTWINSADKAVLTEKVEKVKVKVAYPDWLDKEDKLKETTFLEKPPKDANAVTLVTQMQKLALVHKLNSIETEVKEDTWLVSPAAVDVFYDLASNSLTIPAGILHAPFFHAKVTFYLNYAGLGVEVAKNLLKAVGLDGVDFTFTGQLKATLSEEFLKKHEEKVTCYMDAYKDIKFNDLTTQIDTKRTLDENMADNEALKVAHFAFKNSNFIQGLKLPSDSLENFSDDQLFLISYGSSRCHHVNSNTLYTQLVSEDAAPLANRTFVSLKNHKNFTEAWDCEKGSKYVPGEGKICSIWL